MSESDLLKRITELEAWNLELLAENERFREMLGLPQNISLFPSREGDAGTGQYRQGFHTAN